MLETFGGGWSINKQPGTLLLLSVPVIGKRSLREDWAVFDQAELIFSQPRLLLTCLTGL